MRRPAVLLLVACALGVGLVAAIAAADARPVAFAVGTEPAGVAARVPAGATACQGPLDVPTAFAAAEVRVEAPAGARLEVVRSAGRARLAAGAIAPARGGAAARTARLDRAVPAGERVDVCLSGRAALAVHGGPGGWAPASGLRVDGRPAGTDATVALLRAEPASLLALLPEQARRASLFRPGWVGPWTYAVLLAAVVLAVPALLAAALRRAAAGEPADA